MPTFRNALGERLIRRQSESIRVSGAVRRASVDINNLAASIERQTSGQITRSGQVRLAQSQTQRSNRLAAPQTTTVGGVTIKKPQQGSTIERVLSQKISRQVIGGELVEVQVTVYINLQTRKTRTERIILRVISGKPGGV